MAPLLAPWPGRKRGPSLDKMLAPYMGREDDELGPFGVEEPAPPTLPSAPDVPGFLNTIQQIESSGGQNTNHPTMQAGIHAGEAAMGKYGLMPNTLREIANRARLSGQSNPEIKNVGAMADGQQMKAYIEQHPEVEQMFAEQLAGRLLKKFPNEEQAAYSWNQGHNLSPEAVAKRKYKDHDYVKKFNQLRQLLLAGKS